MVNTVIFGFMIQTTKVEEKTALEELAKNGIKITEVSPELKKELDVIANDLLTKYLDGANSQIKTIFKEYRK